MVSRLSRYNLVLSYPLFTVTRAFIQSILKVNPKMRPSIENICRSTWMIRGNSINPRPIYCRPLYNTENCFYRVSRYHSKATLHSEIKQVLRPAPESSKKVIQIFSPQLQAVTLICIIMYITFIIMH